MLALPSCWLAAQPIPCTYYDPSPQNGWPAINAVPSFLWRSFSIDSTLNFNGADYVNGNGMTFNNLPYSKNYTLVMVCKPQFNAETMLWNLDFGDSVTRGLSTENIFLRNGGTQFMSIWYGPYSGGEPMIATLRQSAPDAVSPSVQLTIGDAMPLKVAEVQYYNERIDDNLLLRVQSRLAIRYGITLGYVNYVSSRGETIWDCMANLPFHHRITGVGTDEMTGLHQMRSRSEMKGSMLTVSAYPMCDDSYLLIGDDNEPLCFENRYDYETGGWYNILLRRWRAQNTRAAWQPFTLTFDKRNLPAGADSLVLILDETAYRPYSEDSDSVVFENVLFPWGTSQFTLGYGTPLWQRACCGKEESKRGSGVALGRKGDTGAKPAASVYPNPTRGHFTLAVSGADKEGRVSATVYNTQGAVVATFSGSGRESYTFEGDLPSGNIYYATISTDNGSQTIKLVVK